MNAGGALPTQKSRSTIGRAASLLSVQRSILPLDEVVPELSDRSDIDVARAGGVLDPDQLVPGARSIDVFHVELE